MKNLNILIPAGGNAERVFPFSKDVSKLLLKVNHKYVIDLIIEEITLLFKGKCKLNIIIVSKSGSLEVESYCKKYYKDIKIVYVEKTNNPVDTINFGLQYFNSTDPLIIWLSDTLIKNTKFLPIDKNFICVKELEDQYKWCIYKEGVYYNKPTTYVKGGKALVGIYGFKNTNLVKDAFIKSKGTEISDILITFKCSPLLVNQFFNFGDLGDYYKSCSELLSFKLRPQNTLKKDDSLPLVIKTSKPFNKLKLEYNWYKSIKGENKLYIPTIISFKKHNNIGELKMSYEQGMLLSDLFVDNEFKESLWHYLISSYCKLMFTNFYKPKKKIFFKYNAHKVWVKKSIERLNEIPQFSEIEKKKLIEISNNLYKNSRCVSIIHGDSHLGNILFDFSKNKFILLDPRGSFGFYTLTGDIQYDLAKLYHSLVYSYLSTGVKINYEIIAKLESIFDTVLYIYTKSFNLDLGLIKKGALLLIATCIKFHPKYKYDFIKYIKENL